MRIFYFSDGLTILLIFICWFIFQLGAALLCLYLPDRFFNPDLALFRTHAFEDEGRLYERLFRVRSWKQLLPDGGKLAKKRGYSKRYIHDFSEENLNRFLLESCRAEASHWLAILPFWVFGFFVPPHAILLMLLYALVINMPCIIAQRYNRPRIQSLIEKKYGSC